LEIGSPSFHAKLMAQNAKNVEVLTKLKIIETSPGVVKLISS